MKIKIGDSLIAVAIIGIVLLVMIPLRPGALDFLFIFNILISIVILLTALYITQPLQFSVFPALLLIVTLFRLGLNVAATRLILSNSGYAGKVVNTFGSFVIGDNFVVGIIIFLIMVAGQFIVITKGTERVSEVAARFTLDAMPGKQMAIDADLNSGIIDEATAKARRRDIQREADFYGSMDGASKFIKGDAIIGIIITIINFVGGIIIGMVMEGMTFDEVLNTFALSTIGNGILSQVPALLVSTASGITVTRTASDENIGADVRRQLFRQPTVMKVSGIIIAVVGLLPGMPKLPMILLAALFIGLGSRYGKAIKEKEAKEKAEEQVREAKKTEKTEDISSLLQVDKIELEFGYNLIPLVDANQGGDLLDRIVAIRRQCAIDLGMVIPVIRLRDNMQLKPDQYMIKIKGAKVAEGVVFADRYMAIKNDDTEDTLEGIDTLEPAFGLPAKWVDKRMKGKAETLGYTLIEPSSVIATHLTEVLKRHGHELLDRQQVKELLDMVKATQPALVEETVPKAVSLGELQRVLCNLLREAIPIKDMTTILETLSDYGPVTKDTDMLTEYVRQNMRRIITSKFIPEGSAPVMMSDPDLEQLILSSIQQTKQGSYVNLEPNKLQSILNNVKKAMESFVEMGFPPIMVTSPIVRFHLKRLTEPMAPDLVVLSFNEIEPDVRLINKKVITA
ncbi:MAG: flagellar biosynthesis protein FlhA [Clostridiaceae bacterium]|jgi:flagellar biosynthesis protein FlhA|nr:flagellar biosynthesis protein FlhA [Clostridiaceae bacterium]